MSDRFPSEGMELTHILVVTDLERAVRWYRDVLGAELLREYGGSSAVFLFAGAWLLLVTGGGPTPDKPDVRFVSIEHPGRVSHAMTIRVPVCVDAYETLRARRGVPDPAGHVRLGGTSLLPRSRRSPVRDQ